MHRAYTLRNDEKGCRKAKVTYRGLLTTLICIEPLAQRLSSGMTYPVSRLPYRTIIPVNIYEVFGICHQSHALIFLKDKRAHSSRFDRIVAVTKRMLQKGSILTGLVSLRCSHSRIRIAETYYGAVDIQVIEAIGPYFSSSTKTIATGEQTLEVPIAMAIYW